ncbi:MAG: helix-turn-helix domain-containing protein [Actinomycetota bacterium]|nr:helix-turn-helix domain-containing protein [Actinomycetota bacterium]
MQKKHRNGQWSAQYGALGEFIRSQRRLANLSLRQLAELTNISNPYLSAIERGLHEPSVRVLKAIADALEVSTEVMLRQAGLLEEEDRTPTAREAGTVTAIRMDSRLSEAQKEALIRVYRSYVSEEA